MELFICELTEAERETHDNLVHGIDYEASAALNYIMEERRQARKNGVLQSTVPALRPVVPLQDALLSPHLDSLEGLVFENGMSSNNLADVQSGQDTSAELAVAVPPLQRSQEDSISSYVERLNKLPNGTAAQAVPADLMQFWNTQRKGKGKAEVPDDVDGKQDLVEHFCGLWTTKVAPTASKNGSTSHTQAALQHELNLLDEDSAVTLKPSSNKEVTESSPPAPTVLTNSAPVIRSPPPSICTTLSHASMTSSASIPMPLTPLDDVALPPINVSLQHAHDSSKSNDKSQHRRFPPMSQTLSSSESFRGGIAKRGNKRSGGLGDRPTLRSATHTLRSSSAADMWYGPIEPLQVFPSFISYDSEPHSGKTSSTSTEVTVTPASSGVFEEATRNDKPDEDDMLGFPAALTPTAHALLPDLLGDDVQHAPRLSTPPDLPIEQRLTGAPVQPPNQRPPQPKPIRTSHTKQSVAVTAPLPDNDWRTLMKDLDQPLPVRKRSRAPRARSPSPEDPLAAFLAATKITAQTTDTNQEQAPLPSQIPVPEHAGDVRAEHTSPLPSQASNTQSQQTRAMTPPPIHQGASPAADPPSDTSSALSSTAVTKKVIKPLKAKKWNPSKYVDVMADFDKDLYAPDNGSADSSVVASSSIKETKAIHPIDQAASFVNTDIGLPSPKPKVSTSHSIPTPPNAMASRPRVPISLSSGLEALSHRQYEQPVQKLTAAVGSSTPATRISHFVSECGEKPASVRPTAEKQGVTSPAKVQTPAKQHQPAAFDASKHPDTYHYHPTTSPDVSSMISPAVVHDTMNVSRSHTSSHDKIGSARANIVDTRSDIAIISDPTYTSHTQMRAPSSSSVASSIRSAARSPSQRSEHSDTMQQPPNSWQSFTIKGESSNNSNSSNNMPSSSRHIEHMDPSQSMARHTTSPATGDLEDGWTESEPVRRGTRGRLPPGKWRSFQEQSAKSYTQTFQERAPDPGTYRGDSSKDADGSRKSPKEDLDEFDRMLNGH